MPEYDKELKTEVNEKAKPSTAEEWLARELEPTLAHELGHFVVGKIIDKDDRTTWTGHLEYNITKRCEKIDSRTDGNTVWRLEKVHGTIRPKDRKVFSEEEDKIIATGGVAVEMILGLPYQPNAQEAFENYYPRDKAVFKNDDEFANYVLKARAMLEPYAGLVKHTAKKMAKDVAEYWGLGEYRLKISEKDLLKYLEEGPLPARNLENDRINDLYDEIARSPNPIQALKSVIRSDRDPLPKYVQTVWLQKMENYLHDPDVGIAKMGSVGLAWYLMRQIPYVYDELKMLELEPGEFFSLCVASIQETLADRTEPIIDCSKKQHQYFYLRGRKNIELTLCRHLANMYETYATQIPALAGGAKAYADASRLYYMLYGKTPNPEEILILEELAKEKGMTTDSIALYANRKERPVVLPHNFKFKADHQEQPEQNPTYEQAMQTLMEGAVEKALTTIAQKNPRYAKILKARFGIGGKPLSLQEIGQELGVGEERVRQVKERALRRLRHGRFGYLKEHLE